MGRTQLTSREIGSVQRNDFDTTTTTQAVITKVIAGTNVTISSTGVDAGTGDVTINASGGGGGGITVNEVTGTSQALAVDNEYIMNNVALVTGTLPATAVLGKRIYVTGKGAGGWKIAQNSGQLIKFLHLTSITGVTGYLASTQQNDSVVLECTVADTTFTVIGSVGNLSINV